MEGTNKISALCVAPSRAAGPAHLPGGTPLSGSTSSTGRMQPWRQRLVVLTLISSDILLALLVWYAASIFQDAFGRGAFSVVSTAGIAAIIGVWVGLRALLRMYPGHGLDYVEELRCQTYAVAAALAITSVFALAFQARDLLSRLLLVSGYFGLLFLAPLLRHVTKQKWLQSRLWGKQVVILGTGKAGERLLSALQRERSIGLRPIAVFDNRLAPAGGVLEGVPYGGTLTDAMGLARERVADTAISAMPHARRRIEEHFSVSDDG